MPPDETDITISRTVEAIVAGLHLPWTGVWQRPNHLLTRFAQSVPVIVVEECRRGVRDLVSVAKHDDVFVVSTERRTPEDALHEEALPVVNELLEERSPLVWLYTPMMLALAEAFCDAPLVYDKMDELAKFAHADPRIASREAFLLRRADIVFTGGRSLHRTVAGRTRDARCYPSGVDVEHFRRGRTMSAHPALDPHRGRPIFGYIGVIDERLDLGLIERLAAARPDAVVALVGPVAKIDERTLPRRENIAYLGKAGYDELPRLLAAFDVALMPFALNEHTENISPTKTLEYLAAGRPVVSTAVPDVVADHADVVHVAASTSDFIDAVSEALRHDRGRQARADAKIALATWDAIASAMERDLAAANILLRGVRNDRLGTGGG